MNLVATFIVFLEISYALCRHVAFQHSSDNLQRKEKPSGDEDKFGLLHETFYRKLFGSDSDKKFTTEMHDHINANRRPPALTTSEKDIGGKREKRAVNGADCDEIVEMDTELNNEIKSSLQTKKNKKDEHAIERYVTNFYIDMINLFQYELKEIGDRERNVNEHRRKHRKSPSLRPKRSFRSLLKDAHIKNILRKYFQQKQKQDHGNPLLRYG